jgi:hypothetical protein
MLLSCYMFRHRRHLQGVYTKISLKRTTINSLQKTYIFCDVSSEVFVTSAVQFLVKLVYCKLFIAYVLMKSWCKLPEDGKKVETCRS